MLLPVARGRNRDFLQMNTKDGNVLKVDDDYCPTQ